METNTAHCPFCKVHAGDTTWMVREGKNIFVVMSNPKLMDGHLLVIPKRHVEKISQLTSEERIEFFDETVKLQEIILEKIAPGCDISEHYRPFIPDNALKVSHLHMHIRPRFLDDQLYTEVQKFESAVFKKATAEDVEKYRELLK